MGNDTDRLTDIFLDVAEEGTLVETQEEGPSHAPIEDATLEAVPDLTRDGLEDAVDGSIDPPDGGG